MRRALELLGELALLGLGVTGLAGILAISKIAAAALLALGVILAGLHLLSLSFLESAHAWPTGPDEPKPLRLGVLDYCKALIAWMLGFHRTYGIEPGLYHTGERHDARTPLLVTANYHLSVFLVARRVRATGARLLVIDTDGINVWCAAGKGRFSNDEIAKQLSRYPRELLTDKSRVTLILPKFGMSGVDLRALAKLHVRPIVGPLYAKDLPAYLAAPPYRHCETDRVKFRLQSRAFVWLPGFFQVTALSAVAALVLWLLVLPWGGEVPLGVIGINAGLATAYPLLFPLIPGHRFAVKGITLGAVVATGLLASASFGWLSWTSGLIAAPFTLAAGILVSLEFTGNSAVSNYSRVKREIVAFLPVSVLLFLVSLVALVVTEVLS